MKHNLSKHKGYSVWRQIRERCHNPSHKYYRNYGARGISLFDDWRTDVTSFINYVSNLPNAFKQGYSLDRIDNNGNYEPNNLRWATRTTQAENSTFGFFGVSKYRGVQPVTNGSKWQVNLISHNIKYYLGAFETEKEAAIAYDSKCNELNLENKILNVDVYPEDFSPYEKQCSRVPFDITINNNTYKVPFYKYYQIVTIIGTVC